MRGKATVFVVVLLVVILLQSTDIASFQGAPQTAATSTEPFRQPSYQDFVSELATEHYGPLLYRALYDPNIMNDAATSLSNGVDIDSVLPSDKGFVWEYVKMTHRPVTPKPFQSVGGILSLTKQLISIGLSRLHRDKQLSLMYARSVRSAASSSRSLPLFKRLIQRCLTAYATQFYIMMQLTIDAMDEVGQEKMTLKELKTKYDGSIDPLIVIMSKVTHITRPADIEGLLKRADVLVTEYMTKNHAAAASRDGSISTMFPLEYGWRHYKKNDIPNGKFWNSIRPTATCSTLFRLGEVVDGCRFLCNAEYLLSAGGSSEKKQKFFHKIAGFGSNNEYDWEVSLKNMFESSSRLTNDATHELGWITIFDCTIGAGQAREWLPLKELTERPIGFGHASRCLDADPNNLSVSLVMLKPLLRKSEAERINAKTIAANHSTVGELVTRYRVSDGAMKMVTSEEARWLDGPGGVRLFDELTILKWDVEGYEHNVLPRWARDELRCLAQTVPAKFRRGDNELIDSDVDCTEYFTPSLLNLELHRMGHTNNFGASIESAFRAHFTLLHAYSLGFVMVAQEKNHIDNCCYELAFVHVKHFVRSELWMVVGDDF